MSDLIIVDGIEFYAHHGVTDEEQAIGHRYFVDLTLELDLSKASQTDDVNDTVSYSQASRLVVETASSARYRLLERLAAAILDRLFEAYPAIQSITLKVGKRFPPAKLIIESASVQMTQRR